MSTQTLTPTAALVDKLQAVLGADNVRTDKESLVFFSTDTYTHGTVAEVVISPPTAQALAKAVALCAAEGRAMMARGGGFSYSSGYIPDRPNTVIVDLRKLDRIVEINGEDLYVTVECGCTWETLYQALKDKGLRTPFMGPASGYWSTIGGNLSQGGFFFGSTQNGPGADICLGLEVCLADGTLVTTGSGGSTHTDSPFLRYFGPDLTGLFLNDTGALGFKTKATLRLMPAPKELRFGSYLFDDMDIALAALSDIARTGVAAEAFVWDPFMAKGFVSRTKMAEDLKYLGGVVKSGGSLFKGLKAGARMAMAGKKIFEGDSYMLHVTVEDASGVVADERIRQVQAIITAHGGGEVEASAPRAARGLPFSDFPARGAEFAASRNLPTHGLFPHSRAVGAAVAIKAMLDSEAAAMAQKGVTFGMIFFAVGSTVMAVEPLMFWQDPQLALHDRVTNLSNVEALGADPQRSEAAQEVARVRAKLVEMFVDLGGCFFQIGRAYPYRSVRQPSALALLEQIKALVDPKGLINPGALEI